MNTNITTSIPVEVCEKIKQHKWAYNDLLLLGIKAMEEKWEEQIKDLVIGNLKLQAKITELLQVKE